MSNTIYLDNAATTPVLPDVVEAMLPFYTQHYGNPSSMFYEVGSKAHEALQAARETVARCLGAQPNEIFFTSCGTEADNWAIKGTAHRFAAQGKNHLITTSIEHHAVLHSMSALEKEGFRVTYLPVDENGLVNPADVEAAICPETCLVTVMFANNEIGTIEPIAEIGAICRKHKVWFHTDAVQAVGALPIDVSAMQIDMLSLSGHKFNAPKGVGALYVRRGIMPLNFMDGGGQERKRRAGTENVAGIVGLATALQIATDGMTEKTAHITALRDAMLAKLSTISNTILNGPSDLTKRLPNNINMSFPGAESESLLLFLNMQGICASSGSACASGDLDPSHVLLAIGVTHGQANCSLRLSFGHQNTLQDAETAFAALENAVAEVRRRSAWDGKSE